MNGPGAASAETPEDFGPAPEGSATRWKAEIEGFAREREDWVRRVEGIERRYRDQRDERNTDRRFALLWANVQVLLPTLYARDPKPEVSRRWKDRDPVGRVASTILERNLTLMLDQGGVFHRTMRAVVQDVLLAGQGAAWVRYEARIGVGPDGQPATEAERAHVDYVHWRDFGFTAGARCWDEVDAVWRRAFMTREALVRRFGPERGGEVPLDRKPEGDGDEAKDATYAKATVHEVWCRTDRTVRWVHLAEATLLDEQPYPLRIAADFPCPAPLFATMTSGSTVPVPDYVYYQDQAHELDTLTGRITALTKCLRMAGFAAGDAAPDLQRLLELEGEGRIIPVPGWAAFGGQPPDKLLAWLPVGDIAQVLMQLHELRQKVKDDAYEITGLSDILRGVTQASETATAQGIKERWGSVRVRNRQADVQRFAADLLNLVAQVMVGHFDAERLATGAGAPAMAPEEQQLVPTALALLKGDGALLSYRIDIETDSTIEADQAAQKQAWTEMLTGISAFMGAMLPVMQGVAQAAPQAAAAWSAMVGELLVGVVRQLRPGPAVEASIEAAFQALGQAASQPPPPPAPPPPDPRADAARMQAETGQQRLQLDAQKASEDTQHRDADRKLEGAKLQVNAMLAEQRQAQQPTEAV